MLKAEAGDRATWMKLFREAAPRRAVEELLAERHRASESWEVVGWCDVCSRAAVFACDWSYSDGVTPNFRERLVCDGCSLNARQRLVFRIAQETLANRPASAEAAAAPAVYVYEQVTPLYRVMAEKLSNVEVIGSEYLGHDVPRGTYQEGIRHEDALQLSFEDERFDLIASNDVYEHVPDIRLALKEAHRVLRPGGALLATLPFSFGPTTLQRARLVDGHVDHLLPAEYHGNPVSAEGSLVFYLFGWDLLDMCRDAGFSGGVSAVFTHSFFHGYLGSDLGMVLRATKAAHASE